MMITLMKHEWLRTRSLIGAVLALATLVTILSALLTATGWPVLSSLALGVGAVTLVILAPAVQIALTADYWRSSYGHTGYFTHAIPVRGSTIYAAKLLWVLVMTVAALVATGLLAAVFWLGAARPLEADPNFFAVVGDLLRPVLHSAPVGLLIVGLVLFIGSYFIWPIQYYFSISLGSEQGLNRLGFGGPVLVFMGLYLVSQVLALVGMLAIPFGLNLQEGDLGIVRFNLLSELTTGVTTSTEMMPLGFLPALLLLAGACLWRTVHSWNRRVALA